MRSECECGASKAVGRRRRDVLELGTAAEERVEEEDADGLAEGEGKVVEKDVAIRAHGRRHGHKERGHGMEEERRGVVGPHNGVSVLCLVGLGHEEAERVLVCGRRRRRHRSSRSRRRVEDVPVG